MGFGGKVVLGSFVVDEAGGMSARATERPPRFSVRWRGRRIGVRLERDRIALHASLGMVPSTAALLDHTMRARSLEAVQRLSSRLPAGWKIAVPPDYRVNIEAEMPLAMPPTAIGLIAEVARFILELDPFLDFLDEVGLDPDGGAGSAGGGGADATAPARPG